MMNLMPQGLKLNFNLPIGSEVSTLQQQYYQRLHLASLGLVGDLVQHTNKTYHDLLQEGDLSLIILRERLPFLFGTKPNIRLLPLKINFTSDAIESCPS